MRTHRAVVATPAMSDAECASVHSRRLVGSKRRQAIGIVNSRCDGPHRMYKVRQLQSDGSVAEAWLEASTVAEQLVVEWNALVRARGGPQQRQLVMQDDFQRLAANSECVRFITGESSSLYLRFSNGIPVCAMSDEICCAPPFRQDRARRCVGSRACTPVLP